MPATVDILIPTFQRPAALAVTLAGVAAQDFHDLRVVVSDQTPDADPPATGEVRALLGILRARGIAAEVHKHLPRRGMAEHRQSLLDRITAPYALFLDDDVYLEPDVVGRLVRAIREQGCGFVGCALIGPSFLDDVRPPEQIIEFWDGPVQPEEVRPGTPSWNRHRLHSAANIYHLQQRLGLTGAEQRAYKVAWVGGCVLYDSAKLRAAGGFGFWAELPAEHCGEDVLAQIRVMRRYGGCGLIPSGAYHLDLPTTIADRRADAPQVLRADGAANPRVSVLIPILDARAPIGRSLEGLHTQTLTAWELIVVDGSAAGGACAALSAYLDDPRVRYYRQGRGRGFTEALNEGLERARAPLMAYLPPGGVYDPEHLAVLSGVLESRPDAVLAWSGLHGGGGRPGPGGGDAPSLQLVQIMHRRTPDRLPWSDGLAVEAAGGLLIKRLRRRGAFVATGRASCAWLTGPGSPTVARPGELRWSVAGAAAGGGAVGEPVGPPPIDPREVGV